MDFAELINLAVKKGGRQGMYNWPNHVREVYYDVYGSESEAGGRYGNSFQIGLSWLLPSGGTITNFMGDAMELSLGSGMPIGQATVRLLSNRQDSALTNTDMELMEMKAVGDYLNGNLSNDDVKNITTYTRNLTGLKRATSAVTAAQRTINSLERDIQRNQEHYENSRLGKGSTKGTYEPRLADLRSKLEQARADLPVQQGKLNETVGAYNTAYNSVANLNTSMPFFPADQAASVFGGGTTSDFKAAQQGIINQAQAAQQTATQQTAAQSAGQNSALEGLSSSLPYSDETVSRVTDLLNSGEVDVSQVSSHFNVPIPSIIQALTGISRDAYTSGDDIANADVSAVMKMINSGVASVADVADYFSSDPSIIESYLTDVELYSDEDLANARQGVAVASAGVRNIAADGDYTEAEIKMVTDSINSGLLSTAQVAQQFGVSEDDVITYMANQNTNNQNNNNQNNNNQNNNNQNNANQNNANQDNNQNNNNQANTTNTNTGLDGIVDTSFSGNNTAADQAAIPAQAGAEIPTGLRGSEMALRGGASGAIEMLDQLNRAGRGDLTTQNAAALASAEAQNDIAAQAIRSGTTQGINSLDTGVTGARGDLRNEYAAALENARLQSNVARTDITDSSNRAEGMFNPYQEAGTNALQQQLALSGALGQDAFNAAYQESPQIAFLREQGMRANLAGAGATGGLGGGNVQKELQRFGQGLASQGLQQQIGNLNTLSGQGLNATGSAAGIATNAGSNLANIATGLGGQQLQAGTNMGGNLADINMAQGQAQLGAYTAQGSNLANLATGLGSQQLQAQSNLGNQLAQYNLNTGLPAAQTISSLGNNLASGRTQAGRDLSNQYGAASTAMSNIYGNQGRDISDMMAQQTSYINSQLASGAMNEAQAQTAYSTALASAQSNIGSALSGVQQTPLASPKYAQSIGNALQAGGAAYNMFQPHQNQNQNQGINYSDPRWTGGTNPNGNFTNQNTANFANMYSAGLRGNIPNL